MKGQGLTGDSRGFEESVGVEPRSLPETVATAEMKVDHGSLPVRTPRSVADYGSMLQLEFRSAFFVILALNYPNRVRFF
jgi:hypothetical protein